MAAAKKVELAADYYLEHFEYLLQFVQTQYAELLKPEEKAFIQQFERLSHDARCLLVRLANRKPRFFRYQQLSYPEIGNLHQAIHMLLDVGLCTSKLGTDELNALLAMFRKVELVQFANIVDASQPVKKLAKADLLRILVTKFDAQVLLAAIQKQELIINLCCENEITLLKFLFFGSLRPDMEQFVIRDLGHVRYEQFNDAELEPYFKNRRQLDDKLAVYVAYEQFELIREQESPQMIAEWFLAWQQHAELDILAQPRYERLVLKVGAYLERSECRSQALAVYRLTTRPPARERQVRLLQNLERSDEAVVLCQRIKDQPQNAGERLFARDFLARLEQKSKRLTVTRVLQQAPAISLDKRYQGQVEQGVLDDYCHRGWSGFYTENHLWRSLFGLLCWDVLFDPSGGAIHHPLQRSPSDLYQPDFFTKRRSELEASFDLLNDSPRCQAELKRVLQEKWGIANPFVTWHEDLAELIEVCCTQLAASQIKSVLLEIARDPKENAHGFPDLMVWNSTDCEFIEVKSARDRLSAQQLHWLEFFQAINIKATVLRVKWA